MRVLIISDTHGKEENLIRLMEKEGTFDLAIHLGDAEGREREIEEIAGCPLEIICGNNDYMTRLPREKEILVEGIRFMLTHGHYYYLYMGTQFLAEEAKARKCQIALYGHTHRPKEEQHGGVLTLNPGSLSYPRQENRRPSYIVMNIDKNIRFDYQICFL